MTVIRPRTQTRDLASSGQSSAVVVASLAALKALSSRPASVLTQYRSAAGDGGGGAWAWRSGNQSANVSADTQSGMWAAPDTDSTGASGAWQRVVGKGIDARFFGYKADASTDNATALQAAVSWCVANDATLIVPSGIALCSTQIAVASAGDVSMVGESPGDSIIKFTNASSAGFLFTMRAYNAVDGSIDRVFMADFTICPGAVHTDAAIKVVYTAHTATAETPVLVRNVAVRPHGVFGTNKFAKGFHGSKIYNGLLERFTFVGASTVSDAGVYLNNCINVNLENPDITYAAKAVYVTTGDGGVAQEQSEGVHVQSGVLYNVTSGVYVDGLSSSGQNALDIRVCNTHVSASDAAINFTQVQQSAVTNCVFYTTTSTKSGIIDSAGFGNIYAANQVLNVASAGAASVGIDMQGASGAHTIMGNYVGGYETGLKFGASTISCTYGGNTLIGNTGSVTNGGTNNIDLVNTVLAAGGTFSSLSGVTGTGSFVKANSPTLTTPNLGTPSAATLTNATGLPISTGVSGLAAGVATFLATPSSANLATAVTDETGSGALVFGTGPTLGSFKMLQSNAGGFAAGEWSRNAGWGTYYKAPTTGSTADLGLFDSTGRNGIYSGSFGTVISYDTGSALASGLFIAATSGDATFAGHALLASGKTLKVNSTQVVGARSTGWTAMTGSTDKATAYDTSTVTLAQLAGRVMALQAALTTHGLIGA